MQNKKRRISNKFIVLIKLFSALGLFFSCCLFLFQNFNVFKSDIGLDSNLPLGSEKNPWWNIIYPVIFIFGLCFIIYYITNMIIRFEAKELWKADRMFIMYQIVFTSVLIITIWRWFFLNVTNALVPSLIMVISGFINIITPKIIDNNNDDF